MREDSGPHVTGYWWQLQPHSRHPLCRLIWDISRTPVVRQECPRTVGCLGNSESGKWQAVGWSNGGDRATGLSTSWGWDRSGISSIPLFSFGQSSIHMILLTISILCLFSLFKPNLSCKINISLPLVNQVPARVIPVLMEGWVWRIHIASHFTCICINCCCHSS